MERSKAYIREMLAGLVPDPEQIICKCDIYVRELLKWNVRINLTAIIDPAECWEKHIQDSLLPLQYIMQESSLLDMGSGAGLPAIPLKLCCPDMEITSVDKVRKKINFQKHCKRLLDLQGFNAITARLDAQVEMERRFAVVTARAMAPLAELIALGSPYVKPGGLLLAMKGRVGHEEMEGGHSAAVAANMEVERIEECHLKPSGAQRQLIFMRKNEV